MNESPAVLYPNQPIYAVSRNILDDLKKRALDAPLKRARLCLHHSPNDAIQEMVIAFHQSTYIRPHRHHLKTESFHMIEGDVLVVFFDDEGKVTQKLHLSTEKPHPFLYRLSTTRWHTVVCLTEYALFHEVTMGPFSPAEFPSWEPKNQPQSIALFKESLK